MENYTTSQLDFGFDCPPLPEKAKAQKSSKTKNKDFVFDLMDFMTSPIIVYESAWKDSIPEDMMKNVKLSRLLTNLQMEEMASHTEALVYMMPRTFEAPLPMEWVNIYTWLGLQYAKQFKSKEQLKVVSDIAPKELSDYEKGLLDNLRRWIYDQRRKALKVRLKDTRLMAIKDYKNEQKLFFKD
ncbi:hypothetical protein [Costertonia aggregata]|uniref:Uncharacterized protein n=1 Tax=Costertonia aggregata TaxID=343403 RepID=A0A7H9AN31_9FLAO|nr:hypothetical protein [Costertonia aggregata]QLG44685.1 hypothetical protein HYG79_04770 [Costertonia aggregata]